MGIVKSAFEKAMERAAAMGEYSEEEKARLRGEEQIRSLLAEFFKGHIDRNALWEKAKGTPASILCEAQRSIVDSLRLSMIPEEFRQRKEALLALETAKEKRNTSTIEQGLKTIEAVQKEFTQGKERVIQQLRAEIERNPHLRVRPMRSPDGKTMYQAALSVDEAVQTKLGEFLGEHEHHYGLALDRAIAKLKADIK